MLSRVRNCAADVRFGHRTGNERLQLGGVLRAAALRFREYEPLRVRSQNVDHFLVLLVGHRSEDDPDSVQMKLFQEIHQCMHYMNIVSTVQQEASDPLEPARPRSGVHTVNYCRTINIETFGGADRGGNVFQLMASRKP